MSGHSKGTRDHTIGAPIRGKGIIVEKNHDAYRSEHKLPDAVSCPQCGASVHKGRWEWLEAPLGARKELCPACQRIHDEFPTGYVSLQGSFFQEHRDELMALVQTICAKAKADYPLQRFMGAQDVPGGVVVTTTDIHLARGIGDALHRAYQGNLELQYAEGQDLLRVHWTR